eukprot:1372746-Pyramimonas_sp.AAC.1
MSMTRFLCRLLLAFRTPDYRKDQDYVSNITSFEMLVDLNEPGDVFYMVLRECAGEPTVQEVLQ